MSGIIFEHGWSCCGDSIKCQSSERWTALLLPHEKKAGGLNASRQNIAKSSRHCYFMTLALFMKTKPPHLDRVAIAKAQYWSANIRVVLSLMGLWFLFGCVLSIFGVDALNTIKLGGFPLGFWMAQQGTTIVFIVIVFCYLFIMKRLDECYARSVRNDEGAQDY